MKVMIIKKENIDISLELNILKKENIEIVESNPDYILTFGGDGTTLKSLDYAIKYSCPIMAINYGRIGYMADIEAKDFLSIVKELKTKNFNLSRRYLLECVVDNKKYYALNEIAFKFDIIGELILYDENVEITGFRGDGLIISTPTGSTAYAMSAGGSIIHPSLKVLNIVAISPQYLGTRPLILPSKKLKVKSKAKIYIDGKIKENANDVVYVSYSDKYIELIEPKNKNYYYILKKKLDWRGSNEKDNI